MNAPTHLHVDGPTGDVLYREIEYRQAPRHSFRYGQPATVDALDVAPSIWAVCTDCTHFEGDDSRGEMSTVLVAHFLYSDEHEARDTAERLGGGGKVGPVTLVRPASRPRRVNPSDVGTEPGDDAAAAAGWTR